MNDLLNSSDVLTLMWRATWQSAILALIVLALVRFSRQWITPRWRVTFLALPLCRLLLLVVPSSSLSLFQWVDSGPRQNPLMLDVGVSETPAASASDAVVPFQDGFREFTVEMESASLIAADTSQPTEPITPSQSASLWSFSALEGLIAIWLIGIAAMLIRWLSSHRSLRRLLRTGSLISHAEFQKYAQSSHVAHWLTRRVQCVLFKWQTVIPTWAIVLIRLPARVDQAAVDLPLQSRWSYCCA